MHLAQYRFYLHSTKFPSLLQSIIFIKISTDALPYKYILSNKKFEKEIFLIFDVTRIFNAKKENASSYVKHLFISFYKNPNGYSNKNTLR